MADNPIVFPIPIPWFKAPSLQFWRLPQAVQRLWEYLKNIVHGGATRFKIKDWELAQALGVGSRCVQKALNLAEALGYIRRYREYGHGGGRVIEIILDLARPKPKAKPRPMAKAPKPAATPEQVAAAKAQELAREQAQARHDLDREARLRAAWMQLTDAQRDAIRAGSRPRTRDSDAGETCSSPCAWPPSKPRPPDRRSRRPANPRDPEPASPPGPLRSVTTAPPLPRLAQRRHSPPRPTPRVRPPARGARPHPPPPPNSPAFPTIEIILC